MKMAESSQNRWKTLWEKEKLLVTSNFFFSLSVFKRIVLQTHKNQDLFGKGLKLFDIEIFVLGITLFFNSFQPLPQIKNFKNHVYKVFWKHCWKRRKCWQPAFPPFPMMFFHPSQNKFQLFRHIYFLVCKCFQSGPA